MQGGILRAGRLAGAAKKTAAIASATF